MRRAVVLLIAALFKSALVIVVGMIGVFRVPICSISVYGRTVPENLDDVRHQVGMGVCPQHDVLYPDLTVKEHLELFAGIKGVPKADIPKAVSETIATVGLTEKVNQLADSLSGGMKRKLSVGIALIGGSKVVILDEPTSGMDPYSRRSTWQMLKVRVPVAALAAVSMTLSALWTI